MPAFGDLAPFGLLEFGAGETDATKVYTSLVDSVRGAFDVSTGTHVEASAYARAIAIATSRAILRHGRDQKHATRAVEMLPALERAYGLIPQAGQSDEDRRNAVAARMLLTRGNRREAIESALTSLLGANFVALRVVKPAELAVWPSSPGNYGTFEAPSRAQKTFVLTSAIAVTGSPVSFSYAHIGADDGTRVLAGERYTFELENPFESESVVISAAVPASKTATATFVRAKDNGASVCSYAPILTSNQRTLIVALKSSAARDPVVRRKVDDLLRRMARASTRWAIVEETTSLHAGPWVLGTSRLGVTPIGTSALALT